MIRAAAAGIVGTGLSFACAGVYIAVSANAKRQRWYTDDYHLTPENMRMPFKRVVFHPRDRDDIDLEGWHIPQTRGGRQSNRLVVLNNPHNSDKSNLLGLAQDLWDSGYSVFMYDFRSHARNESVRQSVGFFEQQDALAALDTVCKANPDADIAVVGASMGGAVALMTAYTCPRVVAVATDCAFARLDDVIMGKLRDKVPSWWPKVVLEVAMKCVPVFSQLFYGYDISEVNPEEAVKQLRLPLFVIHSQADELIPVAHGHRIFENAGTPAELKRKWILPNSNHIGGYFDDRARYSRNMLQFLDHAFEHHERQRALAEAGAEATAAEATVAEAIAAEADDAAVAEVQKYVEEERQRRSGVATESKETEVEGP